MEKIRIILVNPSHPGNIGAAARAMKNMGLSRLYLVTPNRFPHLQATVRAAGADDILANATVTDNLTNALVGCEQVYGTSARSRNLEWPLCPIEDCAEQVLAASTTEVAIVFGRERTGLTNEELSLCHYHVTIPTADGFSSLNLAQAVQVVTYELHRAKLKQQHGEEQKPSESRAMATAEQMVGFYGHLEQALIGIDFIDPKQPKMLMQRLKRLFSRAALDETELNILRGILSAVEKLT